MQQIDSKRFLELDALRGIAALWVAIFHFTKAKPEAQYGLILGVTSVDLFFIISGFVILLSLEKTKNWKDFAVSRFSRLFPLYWTCVTLTAILMYTNLSYFGISSQNFLTWQYLTNMTMFQRYFGMRDLDPPYWTLIVEMLFYLLMLFIFLLRGLKLIEFIGALLLIPIFIYSIPYFKEHFSSIYYAIKLWFPLFNHFPVFLAGILFYKIKTDKATALRCVLLPLCYICSLFTYDDGGGSRFYISFPAYTAMLTIYFVVFLLYVNNELHFIVNKFTLFLGHISFSLYLFHQTVGTKIIIPGLMKFLHFNFWIAAFVALLIVIGIATILSKYVERPSMNYIRKKYNERNLLFSRHPRPSLVT